MNKQLVIRYLQELAMGYQRLEFYHKNAVNASQKEQKYKKAKEETVNKPFQKIPVLTFVLIFIPLIFIAFLFLFFGDPGVGEFLFILIFCMFLGFLRYCFDRLQRIETERSAKVKEYEQHIQQYHTDADYFDGKYKETLCTLNSFFEFPIVSPKRQKMRAVFHLLQYLATNPDADPEDEMNAFDLPNVQYHKPLHDETKELSLDETHEYIYNILPHLSQNNIAGCAQVTQDLGTQNQLIQSAQDFFVWDNVAKRQHILLQLDRLNVVQLSRISRYSALPMTEDEFLPTGN